MIFCHGLVLNSVLHHYFSLTITWINDTSLIVKYWCNVFVYSIYKYKYLNVLSFSWSPENIFQIIWHALMRLGKTLRLHMLAINIKT